MNIPTTQELADQNLTGLEGAVAQTSPLNDAAFLRVLAVVEALNDTALYKYAGNLSLQVLALTAAGEFLDLLGNEYFTPRKMAESTKLRITMQAPDGLTLEPTSTFIGTTNGVRYTLTADSAATGGILTAEVQADTPGTVGNAQVGDTLNIVSQVAGVNPVATVTVVLNTGVEDETDQAYRPRVRFAMRAARGGGNPEDHKAWAEEVGGVVRAFPYAGKPFGTVGDSYPGDRTVYVEADMSLDPDGIPSAGLLAEVRAALNFDPLTGKSRPVLGLTDSTLWVEPVTRSTVNITITNLTTPAGTEAAVRAAILESATLYVFAFFPYIEGVDLAEDKNDLITKPALSEIIQSVLTATGSAATDVSFTVSATPYNSYQLSPGELAKLGVVSYATV